MCTPIYAHTHLLCIPILCAHPFIGAHLFIAYPLYVTTYAQPYAHMCMHTAVQPVYSLYEPMYYSTTVLQYH